MEDASTPEDFGRGPRRSPFDVLLSDDSTLHLGAKPRRRADERVTRRRWGGDGHGFFSSSSRAQRGICRAQRELQIPR
jgi:hypothetical protein